MYIAIDKKEPILENIYIYLIGLVIVAVSMFILKAVNMIAFVHVGQNMTLNIRKDLYSSILRKHMGWHDDREHASGVLSAMLAGDVHLLNGASSETLAIYAEAIFALLWSVGLGYFFSWPLATVFLLLLPLMMVGAAL